MFFVLGLCVMLAALLVLNSAMSLAASLSWKIFGSRISRWPAYRSAQTLFLLRTVPVALGIGSVLFLFGPAYLRHEPRVGHEDVSVNLAILATLSAIGIAVAVVRGIATRRTTSRLINEWLQNAESIQIPGIRLPAYQVEHSFPLIAVVGAFRPRLFIAKQVFQTLSPAELSAALEHETGHLMAHDNLKRVVVRICRDLAPIPGSRGLDNAWLDASEIAADEFAARQGNRIRLDLASAIVKIARMIPAGGHPAMTAGAFLANQEASQGFRARVRNLVRFTENPEEKATQEREVLRLSRFVPVGLTLLFVALTTQSQILSTVHSVIEHAVHILD